jgi:hypothetical protein
VIVPDFREQERLLAYLLDDRPGQASLHA